MYVLVVVLSVGGEQCQEVWTHCFACSHVMSVQ